MTSEAVTRLVEQSRRDPALAAAISAASTPEDVVRIAADHGITIAVEELAAPSGPLSDEELEGVSGGVLDQIWPTTPWVVC